LATKKLLILFVGSCLGFLAVNVLAASLFSNSKDKDYYKFFKDVVTKVQEEYVDEVNEKDLIEKALQGMLLSLDPHSTFFDAHAYQEVQVYTKGEFGGIGVEITMDRGYPKIITPYEDSPAFNAGVKAGDIIISIDGKVIQTLNLNEVAELLRGPPHSSGKYINLNIKRAVVKLATVKSRLLENNIGYISINVFNQQTTQMVREHYEKLAKEASLSGIILDLRWNPGGLFDEGVAVTELFLKSGNIVSIRGRNDPEEQIFKAQGDDITAGLPLVVVINGGSASASEIVASALQDNKRALIVGSKSFGKGCVQTVIPLPGSTAMKLTTGRYYSPSGRTIHENGVMPDIVVEDMKVQIVENKDHDSYSPEETPKYEVIEDFQLIRALDIIRTLVITKKFNL
jgi:carboxyl-terminal processing protease